MKKGLKIAVLVLGSIVLIPVLALFILSQVHVRSVHQKTLELINTELGEGIGFRDFSLSYLRHFPHVHIGIEDLVVKDGTQELIRAGSIDLVLNASTLWTDRIVIDRLLIRNGSLFSEIDSTGRKPVLFQKKDSAAPASKRTFELSSQDIRLLDSRIYFGNQVKSNRTYVRIDEADLRITLVESVIGITGMLSGNLDSLISNNAVLFADQPIRGEEIEFRVGLKDSTKVLENGYILSHGLKLYPRFRMKTHADGQDVELHITGDGAFDTFLDLFEFHVGLDLAQTNPGAELRMAYNQYGFVNPFLRPYSELDFQIIDASFEGEALPYPLRNVQIAGNYNNGEGHSPATVQLEIDTLHAEIEDSYVNARLKLSNLKDPDIDAHFVSRVDVSHLIKPGGNMSLSGIIEADLRVDGRISELKAMHLEGKQQARGSITISDLELLLNKQKIRVELMSGTTLLNNHIFEVTTLIGAYNESAFHFSGLFENLDKYLLSDKEGMGGSFLLSFDRLDLRSKGGEKVPAASGSSSGFNLAGIDLTLEVTGNEILTDYGSITDLHMKSHLDEEELVIHALGLGYQGGHLHGTADVRFDNSGITLVKADITGDFGMLDLNFPVQEDPDKEGKGGINLPDYIEAHVALTAAGVTYRDHSLQNLEVRAALEEGVLSFDRLVMDAFGGHTDVRGEVQFDEGQLSDIALHGSLSFRKLDIGDILDDLPSGAKPAGEKKTPAMPAGIDIDLRVEAWDIVYKDAEVKNLSTRLVAGTERVSLKDFHADLPFGTLDLDVAVAGYTGKSPFMTGKVVMDVDTLSVDRFLQLEALGLPGKQEPGIKAPARQKKIPGGLPSNLDMDVEVKAGRLTYENATVTDFDLIVHYAPEQVDLHALRFMFAGGNVDVSGNLARDGTGSVPGYLFSTVKDLDIQRLFRSFDNFGQDKFTAENTSGKVSWSSHYYFELGRNLVPVRDKNFWIMNIHLHEAEFDKVEPIEKTLFFVGHKARDKMVIGDLNLTTILAGEKLYVPDVLMNDNIANLDVFGSVDMVDRTMDLSLEISLSDLFFRSKSKRVAQTQEGEIDLEHDSRLFLNLTGPLDDHKLKLINRRKFERSREKLMQDLKEAEVEFRDLQAERQ